MATLMNASNEWYSRPDEERFTSLTEMHGKMLEQRAASNTIIGDIKKLQAISVDRPEGKPGMALVSSKGNPAMLSNLAFGQLADTIGAPKGYLSTLSANLSAQAINEGIAQLTSDEELRQFLFVKNGEDGELRLRALNSRTYGRIYNESILASTIKRFGNGLDGDFRVPGEFGKEVKVTKKNTTFFAGDRDMFIFLADEKNRIELPNRRDGQTGALARGFFISNSEVGEGSLYVASFYFDYVCSNRIVWGAEGVKEIKIKHYSGAPERWLDEVQPMLTAMSNEKASVTEQVLISAQSTKLDEKGMTTLMGKLDINPKTCKLINAAHVSEEARPMETAWDAVTGITAFAKSIPYNSERVAMEKKAGKVLDLVANAA